MADELKGIAGQGFFSAHGDLKSKETLSGPSASTNQSSAAMPSSDPSGSLTDSLTSDKITRVFENVSARFSSQTSEIASVANRAEANISVAKELVAEQVHTTEQLKKALHSGDATSASLAVEKLRALQEERTSLAKQIGADNREDDPARIKNLSLGNQPRGIVQVDSVQFSGGETPKSLGTIDEVNGFLTTLKEDQHSISTQQANLSATRAKIEDLFTETRTQIGKVESDSIQTYGDADRVANTIASAISKAGSQAVLVNNMNESVARALLN